MIMCQPPQGPLCNHCRHGCSGLAVGDVAVWVMDGLALHYIAKPNVQPTATPSSKSTKTTPYRPQQQTSLQGVFFAEHCVHTHKHMRCCTWQDSPSTTPPHDGVHVGVQMNDRHDPLSATQQKSTISRVAVPQPFFSVSYSRWWCTDRSQSVPLTETWLVQRPQWQPLSAPAPIGIHAHALHEFALQIRHLCPISVLLFAPAGAQCFVVGQCSTRV